MIKIFVEFLMDKIKKITRTQKKLNESSNVRIYTATLVFPNVDMMEDAVKRI